jgi:hypothetical protein
MDANLTQRWINDPVPQIAAVQIPQDVLRSLKAALRAVDQDIERTGVISAESVELVRGVRARLRTL